MAGLWSICTVHGVPTLAAIRRAQAAGFAVWSPVVVERRRRFGRRGKVVIERPAYVGYMLLSESVDLARLRDRFRDWRVRLLLGEGGLVSDAAVEDLRALEARWRVAALAPPKARIRFVIGSRIVVHLGLFAGCTGKMLVDQGGTHVRVDIALPIGSVTLPAAALIPMPIAA